MFRGDEVPAVLEKGEVVLTEGQQASVSAAMGGTSGGGPSITINMPAGSNGQDVIDAINREARRTGQAQMPVGSAVRR
jgi:hypothetical protein